MLTIIVNSGNFQPRILTLPKKDFPIDKYNLLLKNSKLETNGKNKIHVLEEKIIWENNSGMTENNEWNHITNEIYSIVDDTCDIPEWCKNATFDRDHGFFNSKCIKTENETFEVIEIDVRNNKENEKKIPFNTVKEEIILYKNLYIDKLLSPRCNSTVLNVIERYVYNFITNYDKTDKNEKPKKYKLDDFVKLYILFRLNKIKDFQDIIKLDVAEITEYILDIVIKEYEISLENFNNNDTSDEKYLLEELIFDTGSIVETIKSLNINI